MANTKYTGSRATKWMRWIARGIGSLVGAYWTLALIAGAIWDPTPRFAARTTLLYFTCETK